MTKKKRWSPDKAEFFGLTEEQASRIRSAFAEELRRHDGKKASKRFNLVRAAHAAVAVTCGVSVPTVVAVVREKKTIVRLTRAQVPQVRALVAAGLSEDYVAKFYGVSLAAIECVAAPQKRYAKA